jgi:type VI secretion system protein ImpF
MARSDSETVVTLSVLDRLIDREVQNSGEAPMTRLQSVRALRASVKRDLEWLLNTRRIPDEASDEYPECKQSLYNYGLPDFSNYSFSNTSDRAKLLRHIEETVRLFEPRLEGVRVIPVETGTENITRLLRFQIEALLKMDPSPEQITFDTVLQLTSGEYQIRGERSA